jgi:glutamate dehydrogenase
MWILRHRRPPVEIADDRGTSSAHRWHASRWRSTRCSAGACATRHVRARGEPTRGGRARATRAAQRALAGSAHRVRRDRAGPAARARRGDVAHSVLAGVRPPSTSLWLWDAIGALPRSDRWQTQARSRCATTCSPRSPTSPTTPSDAGARGRAGWLRTSACSGGRGAHVHRDPARRRVRRVDLSVALRQLRNLALTTQSVRPAALAPPAGVAWCEP